MTHLTSLSGGTGGFSYGPANSGGGNGLPVTWVSVDAGHTDGGNRIDWVIGSEQNTEYFLVEAANDSDVKQNIWAIVSNKITAAGNSAVTKTYSYLHADNTAKLYYRVKQVDMDGKYTYSKTVYANKAAQDKSGIISGTTEPQFIYPNPASNEINVIGDAHTNVTVMDNLGRVVLSHAKTQSQEILDISNLSPGVYTVGLVDLQGKNTFHKLVVIE